MAELRYPYGYGTGRCTLDELRTRYEPKMLDEYARRLFAWIESRGGTIGIGGGWRSTNPPKPGFAPDGKSFHQSQTFVGGVVGYCAVDLVVISPGSAHRAPTWNEVPKQDSGHPDIARFGLHCNVSTEPWHMQWTDETIGGYALDGWQSWVDAGRPLPDPSFEIDGSTGSKPPPPDSSFDPEHGAYGDYPDRSKPEIVRGASGDLVRYLQGVLRHEVEVTIDVDGHFGSQTEARVKDVQRWNSLAVDGRCGPKTWGAIDTYARRG